MQKQLAVLVVLVLIVAGAINANKSYKKCFEKNSVDNVNNRRCCHLGAKLAKKSYECSVEAVISKQKYLRTLKHKIHSSLTFSVHRLLNKVKQCKRFEDYLQCCCQLRKRRILNSRYRQQNYG